MRLLMSVAIFLSGFLLAIVSYERLVVEKTIGPAAIVATVVLLCVFLFLLVTLLLHKTRFQAVMVNVWLVIASVAGSYVAVDLIAGAVLIQPLSPPLVPDEYRHHKLVPNSFSKFQQRDFNYVQRVNNLGLRGQDRALQKPVRTLRILMLGDSFTMGKGVNDDQTFSVLLESLLNERYAGCSGQAIEVLNGGVDSYAPILSYIQLKRDLYQLEPDVVVLNLDVSDLVQEEAYRRVAVHGADGEIIGVPQLAPRDASLNEKFRVWIDQHLYLTRLVLYHVNRLFGYREISVRDVVTHANFEVAAHTLASDAAPRDEQWAHIFDSILSIKSFAESKGMEFVLSVYPWGHQVSDAEWMPGRFNFMPEGSVASDRSLERIKTFASENDVRLIDLFPLFRAYRGREPLYFNYDNHLTTVGHEVMASGLGSYLNQAVMGAWCEDSPQP